MHGSWNAILRDARRRGDDTRSAALVDVRPSVAFVEVIDVVYSMWMQRLSVLIDAACESTRATDRSERNALAGAVTAIACVCRDGNTCRAREAAAHAATVAYERLRIFERMPHTPPVCSAGWFMRIDHRWFMGWIPRAFDALEGPTTHPPPNEALIARLRQWSMSRCVRELTEPVWTLELHGSNDGGRRTVALTHHCADMPTAARRVSAYTARVRAVMQALRAAKPASSGAFSTCHNGLCGRAFYRGTSTDAYGARSLGNNSSGAWRVPDELQDARRSQAMYWRRVLATDGEASPNPFVVFCSPACYASWRAGLRAAMPLFKTRRVGTGPDRCLDADADADVYGWRDRIANALDLALRRNARAARAMRNVEKAIVRNTLPRSVHALDVEVALRRVTRALNVDVALLYSSWCIAEHGRGTPAAQSSTLGTSMPGGCRGWRTNCNAWLYALDRMREAYDASPATTPVDCVQAAGRFMRSARAMAVDMYTPEHNIIWTTAAERQRSDRMQQKKRRRERVACDDVA